jgi:lysine/ornithine N-monooxygenase
MKVVRSPRVTEMMYDAIKATRQEFLRTQNMNTTFLTNEIINAVYGTSFGSNYIQQFFII